MIKNDFSSTLNEATERGSKMLMLQRLRAALGSDMEWLMADEEQMEKGYYSDDDDTEEKIKEYFFNSGTLEDLLQHIQDNFGLNAEEIKAKMSYKVPR